MADEKQNPPPNTESAAAFEKFLVPTIFGHNIFYYCVKYTTPTIVSTVPLGEPIFASIIAFFLFNELISLNTAIGGALCVYGIFLILKNRSTENH